MSFTGVTSTVNAREFVLLRAIIINRILSLFLGFFICFLVYFVGVKCPDKIYIFHTLSPGFWMMQMYTLGVDWCRHSHPEL